MPNAVQQQITTMEPERLRPRTHHRWGLWVSGAIVLAVTAALAKSVILSPAMDWPVVGGYLFDDAILSGVLVTLELTVLSQLISFLLGFSAAYGLQSGNRVLNAVSMAYIWFFRGTPLLVQLLFWYNLALIFPSIKLGIPLVGVHHEWMTNEIITGFTAALLGLGVNEGAYMAEIIRGGIISVPRGQMEAALSIGMRRDDALRRIVLPQTIRVIIPPTGNQFITLLKGSSLVSVIGGGDLLTRAQFIYGATYQVIPLLVVACLWYLALVSVASVGQYLLERKFDPDSQPLRRIRPFGPFRKASGA
jgi:polar amino acid transport system permease protein